ncbi:hypothetical protein M2262_003660 [Pseudomonas sp. BIGb0408]|uniref:Uncharacterized protein n=1 Tax=Phytopseudomonas flavescens TaxID=29435 RepID=A0A7Y9XI53_9GAMM|nr:hypothetical protein [Pseudomonas sp. BIGb0408]NYH71820.1 hypothetical protein [Pseudomonas flavescens]
MHESRRVGFSPPIAHPKRDPTPTAKCTAATTQSGFDSAGGLKPTLRDFAGNPASVNIVGARHAREITGMARSHR